MLLDQLARSAVVSLRRLDLKYWKAIMHPPVRVTRLSIRSGKVNLMTDRMRRLIIDFANNYLHSANSMRDTFDLVREDKEPLADVGRYHPQIGQVILYRNTEPYLHHYLPAYLHSIGRQSSVICVSNGCCETL